MIKNFLLLHDINLDIIEFTPDICMVILNESVVVARLCATIMNTN
jgi:hypothetical protein